MSAPQPRGSISGDSNFAEFAAPRSFVCPTAVTMLSPYASKDFFFEKALKSLPTALLEAMIAADLTNPGVLRLYPRYSPAELGLLPEIVHVDLEVTSQSCTVSSNFSQTLLRIGAAAAAELSSSCHELGVAVCSVVSSSGSVSLPVSEVDEGPTDGHTTSNATDLKGTSKKLAEVDEGPADGRPTSNATDLQGTQKKIVEVDEGPADGHTASCAPDLSGIAAGTDSLVTLAPKSADFPIKMGRLSRISQKSRISEKSESHRQFQG